MVYREKMVTVVKVDGKILRERDGAVYLPFGSEYSILLKNLESRRAAVSVFIDGKSVLDGRSLIVEPNSSIEVERFIEHMDRGSRFKFIQKTKEIVEHRGDRVDDGIVRVEFAFETATRHVNVTEHWDHVHYCHDYWHTYPPYWPPYPQPVWTCTSYNTSGNVHGSSATVMCSSLSTVPNQDEGITVRGSESKQRFHESSIGTLDQSEVIIIRLRGEGSTGKMVEKPVTVKYKFECTTCGKLHMYAVRFCDECGTAINII